MSLADTSRTIERDIFGALIGMLGGVLFCRLALLAVDIHFYWLLAIMTVAAWTGAFLAHLRTGESKHAIASLQAMALTFRQFCLRIMLWLLGAAAVFGVLSVLTASYDLVGRLAGTAAITAIAAGLLWPFSLLMEREKFRGTALFGAVSVIVAYLLVIPTVWSVGHREEEAAIASLVIMLMLPAGIGTLLLLQFKSSRLSGLVGIVLYVAIQALFMFAIWYPRRWYQNSEIWETGFALTVFGPMAMASLIGCTKEDRHYWRWIGVLSAMLGCFVCIWGTWNDAIVPERFTISIAALSIAVGHANLSLLLPLGRGQAWLRYATILMVVLTAVFMDIDILFELSQHGPLSLMGRAALATGILGSCGSLALVILAALNRGSRPRMTAGIIESITVYCPNCGRKQVMPLEAATCRECGLQVHIRIKALKPTSPFGQEPGGAS